MDFPAIHTQTVRSTILQTASTLQRVLQPFSFPLHGWSASVKMIGDRWLNMRMEFDACCDEHKGRMKKALLDALRESAIDPSPI